MLIKQIKVIYNIHLNSFKLKISKFHFWDSAYFAKNSA